MAEGSQTRRTRCRTGCMKCRVRRRKCDETKPRCRNCIDKNFTCQYGPRLTFLQKNAFTITPAEIPPTRAAYDAIEFVNEDPQLYLDENTWDEGSPVDTSTSTQPPDPTTNIDTDTIPIDNLPRWPTTNLAQHSFSDGDESAVQGLLALGTNVETSMLADFDMANVTIGNRISSFAEFPIVNNSIVSQTRILQLLRHYRYEVASWLDICDVWQSFGITGLQMAMLSKSILSATLVLSETSLNLLCRMPSYDPVSHLVSPEGISEPTMDFTTKALLTIFQTVHSFISNIPRAWSGHSPIDLDLLANLALHAHSTNINSAIYWLFLRLDLSVSLVTDTSISIPLPLSPFNSSPFHTTETSGGVFHYAHTPLLLCARALQFCNDETQPSHRRTDSWMALVDELEQWFRERSQEFHPMLELDLNDSSLNVEGGFPVILFTNAAGIFGNQLYHTAMLLLLLNRPRTARQIELQPSVMSPLWHARRICSISLNNDRRDCWDLSLLASFLVAAKRMTHESQQHEILRGFEQIRTLTGWDISECLGNLREEWGPHDT